MLYYCILTPLLRLHVSRKNFTDTVCLSALYAHHRQMSSVAWEKAVLEFLKAAFSNMNKSNG